METWELRILAMKEWLAVKNWDNEYLFVQYRKARELYKDWLASRGELLKSIVVKTFHNKNEANEYCEKINLVNDLLKNV